MTEMTGGLVKFLEDEKYIFLKKNNLKLFQQYKSATLLSLFDNLKQQPLKVSKFKPRLRKDVPRQVEISLARAPPRGYSCLTGGRSAQSYVKLTLLFFSISDMSHAGIKCSKTHFLHH